MKPIIICAAMAALFFNTSNAQNTVYPPSFMSFPSSGFAGTSLTSGTGNTFLGESSGIGTTNGDDNTFIGENAGASCVTGNFNCFLGAGAGEYSSGSTQQNTFIGWNSGKSTSGYNNCFLGFLAGNWNTSGSQNCIYGSYCGTINNTGTNDLFLGFQANCSVDGLTYASAIGAGATVGTSYTMALGPADSSINVLVGYTNASGFQLDVNGKVRAVSYITISDERFKKNVQNVDNALDMIRKLRPVRYDFKDNISVPKSDNTMSLSSTTGALSNVSESKLSKMISGTTTEKNQPDVKFRFPESKQIGFIAQDVEKILPEFVSTDKNGFKGINYAQMVSVLAEGIKEQDAIVASQAAEISALKAANDNMAAQIATINQKLSQMDMDLGKCCSSHTSNTGTDISSTDVAVLQQNAPNPFNQNTVISYYLPHGTLNASITVTSLLGVEVNVIPVSGDGNGQVTISASKLPAGTYYYKLVIQGRIIDSKKMVLINGSY